MRFEASRLASLATLLLLPAGARSAADGVIATNYENPGLEFVTSIGDVNGDGFGDVMVGSHEGFVFLGSASGIGDGLLETAVTRLPGLSYSGKNMAGAGDVNGDGYDDVIMGFDGFNVGWAELWMGSASGIVTDSHGHIYSGAMSDGYTYGSVLTVTGAGDVNADGYDDVILTTERWLVPYDGESVVAVFHGSAAGIDSYIGGADTRIVFPKGYVTQTAGAGDVNGDGYDDVILGISNYESAEGPTSGVAMVYHGSASGISSSARGDTLLAPYDFPDRDFAERVAGAGDVNADGYDDVIVGAPYFPTGGSAIVYLGSAAGVPDTLEYFSPAASAIEPDFSTIGNGYFAWSVAGAGDVNGDGYDDVIVGAPYANAGEPREGAAFVFLGSETGIAAGGSDGAYTRFESNQADTFFGLDVAGAGDVNGDGLADVIVAAGVGTDEGVGFIYHGRADVDRDGFLNAFDADFDQDDMTGLTDFASFRACYGRTLPVVGGPPADPNCAESDMDADGAVGLADFGLFRSEFGTPPGPDER